MHPIDECPPVEDLRRSLDPDSLISEIDREGIASHVDSCQRGCKEAISNLLRGNDFIAGPTIAAPNDPHVFDPEAHVTQEVTETQPSEADAENPLAFLAPPQQPDELGRIAHYRVLKVLGQGGMGLVLLAEDTHLDRKVALKVMLPQAVASASAKERFLREAKAAAAVKHDNIVSIYQVGEGRGVRFIALEFLEGAPLDKWLTTHKNVGLPHILRIGREMASGLAAAHAKGLIHRDVKPANVWLEAPKGRVKVLDFGLARSMSDDTHLTQSGMIVGTPAHMAPEQARGERVDHRCDLFSLGTVLYRMCTGELPFKGATTLGVLTAIAIDTPKPVRQLNQTIPVELETLITQLLEKKRENRPQTADAVVKAIRSIEVGLRQATPAAGTQVPLRKSAELPSLSVAIEIPDDGHSVQVAGETASSPVAPKKSKMELLIGAALGGLALIAVAGFIMKMTDKDGTMAGLKETDESKVEVGSGKPVVIDQELQKAPMIAVLPPSDKALAIMQGQYVQFDTLELDTSAPFTLEATVTPNSLRGQFFLCSEKYGGIGLNVGKWSFSAFCQRVADEMPSSIDLFSSQPVLIGKRVRIAGVYSGSQFLWFVDGKLDNTLDIKSTLAGVNKRMFTIGTSDLAIFDDFLIEEVRFSRTARHSKDYTPQPRFVTDNDTVALYHCDEGQGDVLKDSSGNNHHGKIVGAEWVKVEAVAGPTLSQEFKGHKGGVWNVDLSADGTRAVSGGGGWFADGQLNYKEGKDYDTRIWDTRSGAELLRLTGHTDIVRSICFSPDAKWVLSASFDKSIRLWDAQNGKELKKFTGHTQPITGVSFIPGSERIASVSTDGTLRVWDVKTGNEVNSFDLDLGQLHAIAISPDGRKAYCGSVDKSVQIIDLSSGKITGQLEGEPGVIHCIAISSDGTRIAAGNGNTPNCVGSLWDVASSRRMFQFNGHAIRFSRDGKQLIVGTDNGDVRILDAANGRVLSAVPGHKSITQGVAISVDGVSILSGGWDGSVKIWKMSLNTYAHSKTAEWLPLFNGKDLTGWTSEAGGKGKWKVVDGTITGEGAWDHLISDRKDFRNFHMRVEVKMNNEGNSGVYFRGSTPLKFATDYEAQICNVTDDGNTGSLFGLVTVAKSPVAPDTWFTYEVIAKGNRIRLLVDGKETADYTETRPDKNVKGCIALQHASDATRVYFRKVEIRELPPE